MIEFVNKYLFGVAVPILLMLTGAFYCIRLKAFHFLHPLKVLKSLMMRDKGQRVSSAKALCLALAGTLGVGNMVGVASAIALGGVGAVFWMWVSALVAMILKYAEIVLAMGHRRFDGEGRPHGAAMYYIRDTLKNKRIGTIVAFAFALLCIMNSFSMGGMIQVNAAADAMSGVFGVPNIWVGAVFALIALAALWRGTGAVLGVTERLVPLMSLGFVVLSLAVICTRPCEAAEAVVLIFEDAFSIKSGVGGAFGFLLSNSLRYGTMRGILSNEAGCGTAPIAHATSDCKSAARQGMWGIFEVFVDTILLCTLTALVLIISGVGAENGDYMMMTVEAYSSVLGELAGGFISVSVLLFALATVLCWGHYGMECVGYISKNKRARAVFIGCYAACVLLGSVLSGEVIWECADLAIGGMTVINLIMLLSLSGEVKRETEIYFQGKL